MYSSQFTAVPTKQPSQFFTSQVNGLMIPSCPTPSKQTVLSQQYQQSVIYRLNNTSNSNNNNNNNNTNMLIRSNPLVQPSALSQQPHYISQPTQHMPFNRFNQHQQFNPPNERYTLQQQQQQQQAQQLPNMNYIPQNKNINPFSIQSSPQYPLMRQSLPQQLVPNQQQQQQQLLRNPSPIRNNKPSQQLTSLNSNSNNNNGLLSLQQLPSSSTGLSSQAYQSKPMKSKEELTTTTGLKYSEQLQQQQQQQSPQFIKTVKQSQEIKPQTQAISSNAVQARDNKTPLRLSQQQQPIQQQLVKQGNQITNTNTKIAVFPQISPQRGSPLQASQDNPILDTQSSLLRQHSEGDFSYPRYAKSTDKSSNNISNNAVGKAAGNANARETSLSFKQDKSPRLTGFNTNNTAINTNKGSQMLRVEEILLSQRTQMIAKSQKQNNLTQQQSLQQSVVLQQQHQGGQQQITKETEQNQQTEEQLLGEDKAKKRTQHNGILLLGEVPSQSTVSTPSKNMSKKTDQIYKQQQQQPHLISSPAPSSSAISGQQLTESAKKKTIGTFNMSNREFFSSQTVLLDDKSFQDNSQQPFIEVVENEEYQYSSVNNRKVSVATQKVQNTTVRVNQVNEKEVIIGSREYQSTRGTAMAMGVSVITNKMGNGNSSNMQIKQNTTSNGIQIFGNSLNTSETKVNVNMQLSSSDQEEEYEYRKTGGGDWDKKNNTSRRENEGGIEGKQLLNVEKEKRNQIKKIGGKGDTGGGEIVDQREQQEVIGKNGLKKAQQLIEESEQPEVYELAENYQSKYLLDGLKDQEIINAKCDDNNDNSKLHEYSLRDDISICQDVDLIGIIENIYTPVSHIEIEHLIEYNSFLKTYQ